MVLDIRIEYAFCWGTVTRSGLEEVWGILIMFSS